MAMIKCRDCENEMSKRAYFCRQCGGYTKNAVLALGTIGGVLGLVGLAAIKYIVIW